MKKNSVLSGAAVLLNAVLILFLFAGCIKDDSSIFIDKDTSYAMGMILANQMQGFGFEDLSLDYNEVAKGFKAFNEASETRMSWEDAVDKINAVFVQIQNRINEQFQIEGEAYLAENAQRSGVITTATGLQYEVITRGYGPMPDYNDTVQVHYEGSLIDGTVFDSSIQRGEPVEFPLNAVISGWTEGLQLMNEGSIYRFVIPSDLAYGPNGNRSIPPYSTLIFRVELISIVR